MEKEIYQIDVEKVLQSKLKDKNKKPSKVLVYLLKKLVMQDRCNLCLQKYGDRRGVDFFKAVVEFLNVNITVKGEENLTPDKKYIFASNHPLGGIDGVALGAAVGKIYKGKIRYILNDLLLNLPGLRDVGVPVNKVGTLSRETSEKITQAFQSDNQMVLFPAGVVSRLQGTEIKDLVWKKNFISSSVQYERDVVPVYFDGRNSALFYLLAKIREKLGIKLNFEMLLLPREMFRNEGKTFNIRFGKPIPWQTFTDKSKTPMQWAAFVKEETYKLKDYKE